MKLKYFLQRTVLSIVLILVVISGLFFFFRLMPGDMTTFLVTGGASEEQLQEAMEHWGLDQPLYVQYYEFMANLLTGDAGRSHQYRQPVWEVVRPRLINSIVLVAPAIITAYLIGSFFGAFLGSKVGSMIERYGIIPPTILGTTPNFFMGILLLTLIGGGVFHVFPTGGMVNVDTYETASWSIYLTRDFLWHYTLPFLTIVLTGLYYPTLIMRSSIVEVSGQDFMFYHRIKGIEKRTRLLRLMRHASLPVVTVFPIAMTRAISGMVLVEVVFNWPGIGLLLFQSVLFRDFPLIQFVFALIAAWIIFGNFAVDIVYSLLDPRVTVGER